MDYCRSHQRPGRESCNKMGKTRYRMARMKGREAGSVSWVVGNRVVLDCIVSRRYEEDKGTPPGMRGIVFHVRTSIALGKGKLFEGYKIRKDIKRVMSFNPRKFM